MTLHHNSNSRAAEKHETEDVRSQDTLILSSVITRYIEGLRVICFPMRRIEAELKWKGQREGFQQVVFALRVLLAISWRRSDDVMTHPL